MLVLEHFGLLVRQALAWLTYRRFQKKRGWVSIASLLRLGLIVLLVSQFLHIAFPLHHLLTTHHPCALFCWKLHLQVIL